MSDQPSETTTAVVEDVEIPVKGNDLDVWVEEQPASEDWETSEQPVGLSNVNPLIVEKTKSALSGEAEKGDIVTRIDNPPSHRDKEVPESFAERELKECTFAPDLSATEKVRKTVESHQYGKVKVTLKTAPEPEAPPFKPQLDEVGGKLASQKRQATTGSQYGKVKVSVKERKPEPLEFQPQLVESSKSKAMRETASPRYLASAEKYKEEMKKKNAQAKVTNGPAEISKYSLYKDRPTTAPAAKEKPNFVVDTMVVLERDPQRRRSLATPPPVKHSKMGEAMKNKASSRYAKSNYTPSKGTRAKAKAEPGWVASKGAGFGSVDEIKTVKNKKTERATSQYSPSSYKPPRSSRPSTAPAIKKGDFNLLPSKQSPLDKAASEINMPRKSKRFSGVPSSGYGTTSPQSSVAAKVQSYRHRSAANQMRTCDYRGEQLSGRDSANSNAENEQPNEISDESMAQINDLIEKAAALDPVGISAAGVPREVITGDEEQLTML